MLFRLSFFQLVKNCFVARFHLYLADQVFFHMKATKKIIPVFELACAPFAGPQMNSSLFLKFMLFRLFVLLTMLNLHIFV